MKKLFSLVCCSFFLLSGCGQTSYYQSNESEEYSQVQEDTSEVKEETVDATIFVQVAGAVATPGVYELSTGSRVYMAIEAAGGLLEDAEDSDINQAALLEDGQKVYVYSCGEREAQETAEESDGLININTASVQELTSLPGIGQSKAAQVISYREANGRFSSIDDIKKVPGIGDGIFNQIKSLIKI